MSATPEQLGDSRPTVPWAPIVCEVDGCELSGQLLLLLFRCSETWRAYLAACAAYGRSMPVERLVQSALDARDDCLASMIVLADALGLLEVGC